MLTNLETEKCKLLHVVLFGQPELDAHLARREVRQLRQRITFSYRLTAMDSDTVSGYLVHRLLVAGYAGPRLFPSRIAREIWCASHGVPRLINILAHKCLLAAYGEGKASVSRGHLHRAIADTESLGHHSHSPTLRRVSLALFGAFSAGAIVFSAYALIGFS